MKRIEWHRRRRRHRRSQATTKTQMKIIRGRACTVETVKIVIANFAKDIFPICRCRCGPTRNAWKEMKCTIEIGGEIRGDVINV